MSAAAVAAIFALGACDWMQKKEPPNAKRVAAIAKARSQTALNACASRNAYERLMKATFDDAIGIRNTDPVNLATLAAHTVVRMDAPVVKSHDAALNVTVCSGRFILELPPGAERGFGGERRLAANIEYAAQPAADGSGLVYQVRGTEPIVYKLAAFDLRARVERPGSADDPTRFAWVPNDESGVSDAAGIVIRPAAFEGVLAASGDGLAAMPPASAGPERAVPPAAPRIAQITIPASTPKPLPSRSSTATAKQTADSVKPKAAAAARQASAEPKRAPSVKVAKAVPKAKEKPAVRQAKADPKKPSRTELAKAEPKTKPKAKSAPVREAKSSPKVKSKSAPTRLAKAEPKAKPKAKSAPVRQARAEPKRKSSPIREARSASKKKAAVIRQAKSEPKKKSTRAELASVSKKKKGKAAPMRTAKVEPKRKPVNRQAKASKAPAKAPLRIASAAPKAKKADARRTKSSRMREVEAALNDDGSDTRLAAVAAKPKAASKTASKTKVAALRELVPTAKPKAAPTRTAAASTPVRSGSVSGAVRRASLSPPTRSRSTCESARSRSGKIVCSDQRLAALHRTTASLDSYAMNNADGRRRAEVARTRSQFLAWRERCQSQACIANAYQDRMDEIRDIMSR
jgi:hypothetical protein